MYHISRIAEAVDAATAAEVAATAADVATNAAEVAAEEAVEHARKIDAVAATGLTGVANSLTYRVAEIEQHLHADEAWYGNAGTILLPGYLDRDSLTPWRLTAGTNEAWGTALQISNGTELESGDPSMSFHFRRIFVATSSKADKPYKVEAWYGTATFGEASRLTECLYRAGSNVAEVTPIQIRTQPVPCNSKVWVRIKSQQNSATLDFLVGVQIEAT